MKYLINQLYLSLGLGLAGLLASLAPLHAQQRFGGGGGGGGGGGFGGGGNRGFGGFGGGFGGASSTASTYNNNGTVGSAVITVDPDTHNIVVTADAVTAAQIREVLAKLDMPKPQVLIKVVFMEVDHNNDLDLGVEGGWAGNNGGLAQSAGNVFGLSALNSVVTNVNALGTASLLGTLAPGSSSALLSSGSFYQVAGSDFQATLRAVAAAGKAQVLSRPSILARDGQLAQIVVGQSVYLPTGVTFATTGIGASAFPVINGSYQPVGIILNVTPFIGDNRLVEMIVAPETSSIDTSGPGQVIASTGSTAGTIFAPNLDVRSADTVVVTPDAQPVVIGGLIGNNKSSSTTKVPLLGDIPLLGSLFQYTAKADTKTELLIFLTPHIVTTPAQLVPMAVTEAGQASSITNSVSEQELDQFLEHVPVKRP